MVAALPDRVFVTGTDTGVGKTVVAAVLVAGCNADYWKPVQTGCTELTDSDWIRSVVGLAAERIHPEAYRFDPPLSPHAAAKMTGTEIDIQRISIPTSRSLIVEGAGGVLVPINHKQTMVNLMSQLALPVLVVARSTLGTINHTLLSVAQLRQVGIDPFGVVLNGPPNSSNREAIEHFGKLPVIAEIEPLETIDKTTLLRVFRQQFQGER